MRKIVVTEFLTMDGVMEEPSWTVPYWSDEIAAFKGDEMLASDALLLGRKTYDGFAQAWPSRTDEEGGGALMNSLPKYVASTTLETAAWNNSHIIATNVTDEIATLKEQPGKNILVYGSADLVDTLLQHDLVDELRLLVYPIVLGSGKRLFKDGRSMKEMTLDSATPFASGVVALVYRRAGSKAVAE